MADNVRFHWMKFFPANFIDDTHELNHDEIGVYVLMVCCAWSRNGRLPLNVTALSRLTGAPQALIKRATARMSEVGLVYEDDGFLRIGMVDRDLDRVEKIRAGNSRGGKRSAEKRRLQIVGGDE
jgi:uncharacterized protein YdaU (DUF1376 family)